MAREALIVATGTYEDVRLSQLRSPAQDAASLSEVLEHPDIGDFAVEQIVDGTDRDVQIALHRFFSERTRDDLLLLHVSCHGVKDDDGRLYFAARDTTMDALHATAVPASFLKEEMERCRAKSIVLLLDCCYAGAFAPGSKGDAGVHLKEKLEGRGRAIITASNAIEYSWEGDHLSGEGRPSVFTAALLEGLKTGEADRDGDGRVSLDELHEYVSDHMLTAIPKQTPLKWELGIEGRIYIARNPRPGSALPPEVLEALESTLAGVRFGVVRELAALLGSTHPKVRHSARGALERLLSDDSRMVREAADEALGGVGVEGLQVDDRNPDDDGSGSPHIEQEDRVEKPPVEQEPPDEVDDAVQGDDPVEEERPLHDGGMELPMYPGRRDLADRLRQLVMLAAVPVVLLLVVLVAMRVGGGGDDDPDAPVPLEQDLWVSAQDTWTDTEIDLEPGDVVTFLASGEACDNNLLPDRCFPPEGVAEPAEQHPGDPLYGANHLALLGSIDDGELFEIGASHQFTATESGRLFLTLNDGQFDDNDGGFDVTVEVERP